MATKRRYKGYLEPNSTDEIPRTSSYNKCKRRNLSNNEAEIEKLIDVVHSAEIAASHNLERSADTENCTVQNADTSDSSHVDYASDSIKTTEPSDDVLTELSSGSEANSIVAAEEENNEFDIAEPSDDVRTSGSEANSIMAEEEENNEFDIEPHMNEDSLSFFEDDEFGNEENTGHYAQDVDDDIFDRDPNERVHDRYLSEELCPCTATTKGEALTMALLLGLKHSMSWIAILDIIDMVNKLYNNDVLPSTKFKLFKYFPLGGEAYQYHIFCPVCQQYIGERQNIKTSMMEICKNCGKQFDESTMSSFFITMNFASQLKSRLKDPNIYNNLNYRFSRQKKNDGALEDIYDGIMYKKFTLLYNNTSEDQLNLSYTFNTDGCQAWNSSNVSIWPIYAMLHELPPKLRARHMFLIGLWVHKKEPNMNTFLQPFVEEANALANDGVQWEYNNKLITSKVVPICCCVDSVARPCLLNMIRFNGLYGCNFCEHPTEAVDGYRKYTMTENVPPDRTDDLIKLAMRRSLQNDNVIENKGVKGPSVLMNLEGFDLVNGMVPDYMHSVLLGVTRQYTEIILTSPGEDYYVGSPNQIAIINRRLLSIQPPTCITRSPRSIQDRRNWKASEWRSWLIWYILICLLGVLPSKYLKHLALLVTAIHILLQESITKNMIQRSEILLIKFVAGFQQYFGKAAMTFNVHLLLHLSTSVRNWGPLWTHNAFVFENENRFVLQMKTSPYLVAVQIARRFLFFNQLPVNCQKFPHGKRFFEFSESYAQNRLKFVYKTNDCTVIGSGKNYNLNPEEEACFGNQLTCKTFQKMICHGLRFTSEAYTRTTKSDDSINITRDGTMGRITNICCYEIDENSHLQKKVVVFLREIWVSERPYMVTNNVSVNHIRECTIDEDGALLKCDAASVLGHCIVMHANRKHYISEIPRGCYGD